MNLDEYISSRLKRLIGSYDIYKNKDGGFLHISHKCKIHVDLSFWTLIKTIDKTS